MNITVNGIPVTLVEIGRRQDIQPVTYFETLKKPFLCANGHVHDFEGDTITNTRRETGFDEYTQEEYHYLVCAECGAGLTPHQERKQAFVAGHGRLSVKVTSTVPLDHQAELAGFEGIYQDFNALFLLLSSGQGIYNYVRGG